MSEYRLQCQVAGLLDSLGWLWFHVPNEGKRTERAGGRLVAAGLKRGVSDIIIMENWNAHVLDSIEAIIGLTPSMLADRGHGIAIELKWGKGTASAEQTGFLVRAKQRGWLTAVCRTLPEVLDVLRKVHPSGGRRIS